MTADSTGYHRRYGRWEHQMSIWGISDDPKRPWAAVKNQWGDVHGEIVDFETGQPWPRGMLRVRPEDLEPAFKSGEVIAYSSFEGFTDRSELWDDWSLVPNDSEFSLL
jgi:hypothetical protein